MTDFPRLKPERIRQRCAKTAKPILPISPKRCNGYFPVPLLSCRGWTLVLVLQALPQHLTHLAQSQFKFLISGERSEQAKCRGHHRQ